MTIIDMDKVGEALNTKADIDLNNTGVFSTNGGGVNLISSTPTNSSGKEVTSADFIKSDIQSNLLNYTTNRILEIPQDIKLDLTDGVLTLKAGSKLWYPDGLNKNGNKNFGSVIVPEDTPIATADTNRTNSTVIYRKSDVSAMKWSQWNLTDVYSGSTAPTVDGDALWYDIESNRIKEKINSTTWSTYNGTFPICLYTASSTAVTSITQVFNGFGYIGSTVYSLPGVKYQFADGRNEDGTYKSITKTFDNVSLVSYTYQIKDLNRQPLSINDQGTLIRTDKYFIQNTQPVSTDSVWYKPETNEIFRSNGSGVYDKSREIIIVNDISTNSEFNITSFGPLEVPTINSYQRAELAGIGMPGDKYIDLSPGASGTTYTAPANGWFSAMNGNGKAGFCSLLNQTKKIGNSGPAAQNITDGITCVPVMTGDTIVLKYSNTFNELNIGWFRFIYSQGNQ